MESMDHDVWDKKAQEAAKTHPLKMFVEPPKMVGITKETAKFLRWKSFKWMVAKDKNFKVIKAFLKHPIKYGLNYLHSLFSKTPYKRDGDLFFYGINTIDEFKALKKDALFVLGFSYCHKPFECPSGRFTDQCIHDAQNPICQQCFIGKCVHFAPKNAIILYIPTVHYISEKILELIHKNPEKQILFLITACEMTLTMFADWGNMANIKGIGVRLDGRICNTMRAFELSENGVKPGLTIVTPSTQEKMLDLLL